MITPRCSRSGPERYRDLGRTRTQVACRLHQVLCELIPGGVPGEITAGQAGQVLASITPAGAVQAARCELAAELTEDLRGIDIRIRETRKKLTEAVRAAGTCLTRLFGVGPVIAAAVIGDVRAVSRRASRDNFASYNGTAPIEVSSAGRKGLPAVPARQPPPQPRDPYGRGHPDPLPAHQRPRLLRQETGRRQNRQRSAARPQTPDQRRHLRLPARRRPARRSRRRQEPGRATGEPLCNQGGRLTPRPPALRASHSRARHPPYDHCSLSRAAAISCERGAGSRTGRSPAAQRRPQGVLEAAAREPIMPAAGKEGGAPGHTAAVQLEADSLHRISAHPLTLKQRGVRSVSLDAGIRWAGLRCRSGASGPGW